MKDSSISRRMGRMIVEAGPGRVLNYFDFIPCEFERCTTHGRLVAMVTQTSGQVPTDTIVHVPEVVTGWGPMPPCRDDLIGEPQEGS